MKLQRIIPIRWYMWIGVLLLVCFGFAAGGYAFFRFDANRIRQNKYMEIAAIAQLKVGQLLNWRRERLSDAERIASNPFFRKAVSGWLERPSSAGLRSDVQQWLKLELSGEAYDDVLLVSVSGDILLSVKPQPDPLDDSTRERAIDVLASHKATLGDFYRDSRDAVHLDILAPLLGADATPIALVVLRSNAKAYVYPLIQLWPTPSRSAETLLVRVDGTDVLFLNELRHVAGAALSLRYPLSRTDVPAVQAILGTQGLFDGTDYRGVRVLADLRPIPDSPWFMIAKVDADEILAEARYRATMIGATVVLLILLAAATTAVAFRQRQTGIYKALYNTERERRETQEEFRTTLYSIGDAVITTDTLGCVRRMNPVAEHLTGWTEAESRGQALASVFRILDEETRLPADDPIRRVLNEGAAVGLANHTILISRDGTERPIADSAAPIRDAIGAVRGVVLVFRDRTADRAAQNALRTLSARQEALLAAVPDIVMEVNTGRVYTWANRAGLFFFGEDVVGSEIIRYFAGEQDAYRIVQPLFDGSQEMFSVESWQRRRDGQKRLLSWTSRVLKDGDGKIVGALCSARDVTERMLAEERREKLEEQLRQARKMEAVGRLAGGVAHDFNNMLSVIIGYSEMILDEPELSNPFSTKIREIRKAAKHSADLTRQLLAFARRQPVTPRVLDINSVIDQAQNMLRRMIGEDISLVFIPSRDLWTVSMDPSQVEELLTNLSANSRDSVQGVGSVRIETSNVVLDKAYCDEHVGAVPGEYVLMSFSDSGRGMDRETMERAFEPFFTTKGVGEGTGLGLATVYGIVTQNSGMINVYSEPGQGTTFKIYLPRAGGKPADAERTAAAPVRGGEETILIVEDEEQILRMCRTMLESKGYTVITSSRPTDAIARVKEHSGKIHLLVTDVVMSEMNGKDLKERIEALKPGILTIFMSGYTADIIANRGILADGVRFLQKPFSPTDLARKVRETLETG
jgi:two-component system cell cycle sensor histidine kinase/response regulator CckA